jgi:hypothetical protein
MKMMKRKKKMPKTEEMPPHPLLLHHHLLHPPAAALEEIDEEGPVEVILEQEAPMPHEVIPQMLSMRYHNSVSTMHDYEENPLRVEDDFDDLDDDPSEDHSDMYV